MNDTVLRVNDLHVAYVKEDSVVEAVKGVDFSVSAGSVLAIIGGSGAGKSSVALAVAGLHDQRKARVTGKVILEHDDIIQMSEDQLDDIRGARVGMIFQDSRGALDPTMKVVNQVAEAIRRHHHLSREEARTEALKRLHSAGVAKDLLRHAPYAHQLSSGLCQRVMISIALAGDPILLVADEPTGSLDLTRQAQIMRLLRERVAASGLGMILITHDLGLATSIADDLLVMRGGSQVEYGPCEEVIKSPGHEYTNELFGLWRQTCFGKGKGHAHT
ncbi:MAG: ABC transporter ATP-binding protein [Gaiellales bacterium]|nr:MAG: ABC transporter ATP-binding protein [Gaiellales bacterium]